MSNRNLMLAKKVKNDEFYTKLADIEKEMEHYVSYFKGKTIFCNCDDPYKSNFFKYFSNNFNKLELKKLVCMGYSTDYAYVTENNIEYRKLEGDGDFRSIESIEYLKESDIIITNPPFSLFREYVNLLMKHNKTFLIIGNKNAVNYNDFFHLLRDNKVWIGYENPEYFDTIDGNTKKVSGLCRWFTNIDIQKRHEILPLNEKYDRNKYQSYENYNAINVDKVSDIPNDYNGIMGVPITFLDKYNPDQFEILGRSGDTEWALNECEFFTPPPIQKQKEYKKYYGNWRVQNSYLLENDLPKCIYYRLFIKRK